MKRNIDLSRNQILSNNWNNSQHQLRLFKTPKLSIFDDYNYKQKCNNNRLLYLGNKKDRLNQKYEQEYGNDNYCDRCGKLNKIPWSKIIYNYYGLCTKCQKEVTQAVINEKTILDKYNKISNITRKNQDIWWYYL